jgi:RNA polymerase sigma-70 factor, ECF subfamily
VGRIPLPHCSQHNRRLGWLRDPLHEAELYDNDAQTDLAVLLQRCAEGDAGSFRRLYRSQAGHLHGIALRITRHPIVAADVIHDAFISVWEFAGTFDPARGSPEAWLVSIVRHRALDTMRRQGREITGAELPEPEEPDPLARMQDSAAGAALHRCLSALEEDQRRLICMAFLGGLTHSKLADQLGLPLGTVKSSIRRGLASLRECLDR